VTLNRGTKKATQARISEAFRAYMKSERYQKMNTITCAKQLGVSKTTISRWRVDGGIPPPTRVFDEEKAFKAKLLSQMKEFGLKDKKSLMSIPDLCKLADLPYHTVFYLQKRLGVAPYGQKYRSDSFRQPLTTRVCDLKMVQLVGGWNSKRLPKGLTEHLETLRER